jgi:hypothetical protein
MKDLLDQCEKYLTLRLQKDIEIIDDPNRGWGYICYGTFLHTIELLLRVREINLGQKLTQGGG